MTRPPAIDPDALTVDAIRDGMLAEVLVTVLGLARSAIAMPLLASPRTVIGRSASMPARMPSIVSASGSIAGGRVVTAALR